MALLRKHRSTLYLRQSSDGVHMPTILARTVGSRHLHHFLSWGGPRRIVVSRAEPEALHVDPVEAARFSRCCCCACIRPADPTALLAVCQSVERIIRCHQPAGPEMTISAVRTFCLYVEHNGNVSIDTHCGDTNSASTEISITSTFAMWRPGVTLVDRWHPLGC